MRFVCLKVRFVFGSVFMLLVLQSCASSGSSVSNNGVKVYNKDFNSMVATVESAVRSSKMSIETSQQSQNPETVIIVVSERAQIRGQAVQRRQGEVRIIKLGKNRTKVKVTNPDYHYSIPEYSRTDYQRIIINRIDSMLEKKG